MHTCCRQSENVACVSSSFLRPQYRNSVDALCIILPSTHSWYLADCLGRFWDFCGFSYVRRYSFVLIFCLIPRGRHTSRFRQRYSRHSVTLMPPPPQGGALCTVGHRLSVHVSVCPVSDSKSRTGGRRKLKIDRKESHDEGDP